MWLGTFQVSVLKIKSKVLVSLACGLCLHSPSFPVAKAQQVCALSASAVSFKPACACLRASALKLPSAWSILAADPLEISASTPRCERVFLLCGQFQQFRNAELAWKMQRLAPDSLPIGTPHYWDSALQLRSN